MNKRHYQTSIFIMSILMIILGSLQIYVVLFKKLSGINMVYFMFTLAVMFFTLGIFSTVVGIKLYIGYKKSNNVNS